MILTRPKTANRLRSWTSFPHASARVGHLKAWEEFVRGCVGATGRGSSTTIVRLVHHLFALWAVWGLQQRTARDCACDCRTGVASRQMRTCREECVQDYPLRAAGSTPIRPVLGLSIEMAMEVELGALQGAEGAIT
jgi:hypothetical protein